MFDSHCHLTDEQFRDDLDDVLARAWEVGLLGVTTIASDAHDAHDAIRLAATDPRLHATAGVHPHVAATVSDEDHEEIARLADSGSIVAIGETGLDFHYDNSPREQQRRSFERHIDLAARTHLPLVVHSRSADDIMADMIRAAAGVRGVLHCFAGGTALFDAAMEMDWFISFAGLVTFRNFDRQDLVRAVPSHRLLAETDSPYLAPVPHRGRRNEPAWVLQTVAVLAAIRGEEPHTMGTTVAANAMQFYGIPAPS